MNSSTPWISLVFFGLAAYFAFGAKGEPIPIPERTAVDPAQLVAGPLREPLRDPPTVMIGGFQQRCRDCHNLFESLPETPADRRQHADVVLDHGLNDRCFNCHTTSRSHEKLVLQGTREIGFDDVVLLCAKCHGPTYRDWQKGTHGKTLGAWDATRPDQHRLGCTECHDPHHPAFAPMKPLPGPNTLRMGSGEHPEVEEDPARESPLLRWLRLEEGREEEALDAAEEARAQEPAHQGEPAPAHDDNGGQR